MGLLDNGKVRGAHWETIQTKGFPRRIGFFLLLEWLIQVAF